MTKTDSLLIIVIVLLAVAGLLAHQAAETGDTAVVRAENAVVETVDLSAVKGNGTIHVQGPLGVTTIETKNGAVRVTDSPCRDKICVNQGWITNVNQSIICVPNHVSVTIQGSSELDSITH